MSDKKLKNSILYCRVSSAKSAQEGESLGTQDRIMRQFVADRGWAIVPNGKVFRENFTGRNDKRPVLEEIFDYIKENPGKVNCFVFRVIDRFTRGGSYSYESIKKRLAAYGVEMIDTYGVIQPVKNTLEHLGFEYEWSKSSPSEIAETVIANTAKAEITTILTRMIGREIELTQQGYQIGQSADGLLNKKVVTDGKKKVIQVPDPERARFYIEMFNLRAAGTHTDKEIVKRVNAMGYRTKIKNRWDKAHENVIGSTGGVTLTVKHLQEIITRPIYCGVVCEKWTRHQPIKARYDGLVSIDTFNRANRGKVFIKGESSALQIFYDHYPERRTTVKSRNNPLFPYKNIVLCPVCRKPFSGSCPKGRSGQTFPVYHCSRKHKYFGVPKEQFDSAFEEFVRNIKSKSTTFDSLERTFLNRYHLRKKEIVQLSINVHQSIAELKAQQKAKGEAFVATTSPVLRSQLEKDIEELEVKIKSAGNESLKIDITEEDITRFKKEGKYILEHLPELLLKPDNARQKLSLFSLIFEELPTYTDIVNGTTKMASLLTISPLKAKKGDVVHAPGFSWNTIESTIRQWNEVFQGIVGVMVAQG
jgi:DNA invertase Pin-like site-specific DNA recombinase/chaperonin cofactor prefoldin